MSGSTTSALHLACHLAGLVYASLLVCFPSLRIELLAISPRFSQPAVAARCPPQSPIAKGQGRGPVYASTPLLVSFSIRRNWPNRDPLSWPQMVVRQWRMEPVT